jgi:tetratricopeptide (TPR) repeat protein
MIRSMTSFAIAVVTCIGPAEAAAPSAPRPDGDTAFDYAFRFASAIDVDPSDKAKAQQGVVMELASTGRIDRAIALADEVVGWRRGAVHASLAATLASKGRAEDGRAQLEKAQETAAGIDGWEAKRIQAHVAEAFAAFGDLDRSSTIAHELASADPRQYGARAAATIAAAKAARGDVSGALEDLRRLEDPDLDSTWWRTIGYLSIARARGVDRDAQARAIAAARESSDDIPGWRRVEALEQVADGYVELGARNEARAALRAADAVLSSFGPDDSVKTPLAARIAIRWADLGDTERTKEILDEALPGVERQLVIDRPGLYGAIAVGYRRAGHEQAARATLDRALAEAEALVNARPRALAAMAICRALGAHGIELDDDTRRRLDALLSGLGPPW